VLQVHVVVLFIKELLAFANWALGIVGRTWWRIEEVCRISAFTKEILL